MPGFYPFPRDSRVAAKWLLACAAAILCTLGGHAQAQEYPSRALRLVVPFPPGGGTDGVARTLSQRLAEALAQPVVVENRPGGGGLVAWSETSRAAPDGYTLVVIANNLRLYPLMQITTTFDPDRDLVPVATIASVPMVLAASRKAPAGGLRELAVAARSAGGKVNSGTVGNGSPHHLASARFAAEIGATFTHIPYKGTAPLVTDLLGEQIEIAFVPLSVALPHLRATPEAVTRRLNAEIVKILDQAPMKESLARQGFEPMPASLEQSAQHLADEIAKWSGPIRTFGIRADQ